MDSWLFLLLLTPLLGFGLFTFLKPAKTPLLAVFFALISFLGAIGTGVYLPDTSASWNWIEAGDTVLYFSVSMDSYALLMLPLVTGISLLVQLFSVRYMEQDAEKARYFGYLQLFTLAMVGVVLAGDLLTLFFCWELVGLSSYLLIGFWQSEPKAGAAALKAFLFNRIGDVGFLIALFAAWQLFGSLRFEEMEAALTGIEATDPLLLVVGFGLLLACMGKSAQFPLSAWLPDAMAGPTPASALIHAATMVAAGVFLLVRTSFLLPELVLLTIAWVGAITALLGALIAMSTFDFKKVLAGSTISQLGYMVVAIGVSAPHAALFHLSTHAFFKAGLFLAAGAIIHQFHHVKGLTRLQQRLFKDRHAPEAAQDMRLMGGVRRQMPVVFWTYTVFAFSLMGFPLFSGFLSKDAILIALWEHAEGLFFVPATLAFLVVLLTAYYVGRQWFGTFFGLPTLPARMRKPLYEVPLLLRVPLVLLALLSFGFAFSPIPWNAEAGWFAGWFPMPHAHEAVLPVVLLSLGLATGGLIISFFLVGRQKHETLFHELEEAETKLEETIAEQFTVGVHWLAGKEQASPLLDILTDYLVIRPAVWLSKQINRLDTKALDRLLVWIAESTLVLGHIHAWFDRSVLDGGVRGTGWTIRQGGQLLRSGSASGRIQSYLAAMLVGLLILLFFLWR